MKHRHAGAALVAALAVAARVAAVDVPVPGTPAHVDVSGYVDGLAVAELGGPSESPQAIGELRFESKLTRALRARLTLRGRLGGPFVGGHPGIMNLVHEFQNRTPSLEFNEAYAELREGDLQIRAGIQKFAWGKLDGVPPTDVLTPRDLHDPLVREFEESKIGIPAIQGTYFLPPVESLALSELRATLVYVPITVPPRLALVEERWFPPSVDSRSVVSLSLDEVKSVFGVPVPIRVPISLRTQNDRAGYRLDNGGIALRLGGAWRGMDWDIYHYTGPETGPDADLLASVKSQSFFVDKRGIVHLLAPANARLRQAHDTIHMTGADWSAAFAGATLRAEMASFVNRPYLRPASDLYGLDALSNLPKTTRAAIAKGLGTFQRVSVPLGKLFPNRDSIEWGVGADYLVEGFLPLIQLSQVAFTDHGPRLLLSNPETRLLASIRKPLLQDTLELELRGVYAIERGAWFVYPRVSYRWGDNWRFRLGYLGIGGPLESYIGQFNANDEFTLEARYSF